jgi:hypothetical protein
MTLRPSVGPEERRGQAASTTLLTDGPGLGIPGAGRKRSICGDPARS